MKKLYSVDTVSTNKLNNTISLYLGLDAANKIRSNARRRNLRVSSDEISAHVHLSNAERCR